MFPEPDYFDAARLEIVGDEVVPDAVSFEFGLPVRRIRFGRAPAGGAAMPKTPINEDREFSFSKPEVWFPKDRLRLQPPATYAGACHAEA